MSMECQNIPSIRWLFCLINEINSPFKATHFNSEINKYLTECFTFKMSYSSMSLKEFAKQKNLICRKEN